MHQDFWELMSSGGPFVTSQGTASSTIDVALKLVTHLLLFFFFFFFLFHSFNGFRKGYRRSTYGLQNRLNQLIERHCTAWLNQAVQFEEINCHILC